MSKQPLPPCDVAWFSALCDDDYEFLGVPDPRLSSSFAHCRDIVLAAESGGFDTILLPSGYALGIDTVAFAGAVAPLTRRIRLLTAIRCGELWPAASGAAAGYPGSDAGRPAGDQHHF